MTDIFLSKINSTKIIPSIRQGDRRILSRCISWIENEHADYLELLQSLPADYSTRKVIGITGAPGAGKSTLIDVLIGHLISEHKKIAVICVDPSSPFHFGALLGDRIRMNKWFNHEDVFIRSLASRGNLGGLNPKVIEITDLLKAADLDYIIIETVGVGQNEVEVAAIADTTIVVLTPGSGDDIQTMKAGLMDIADIFVVNKSDHEQTDNLVKNLQGILIQDQQPIPVLKTIATQGEGVRELWNQIKIDLSDETKNAHKPELLAAEAYQLIQYQRMKDLSKEDLSKDIRELIQHEQFNLYQLISKYT